MQLVIIPTQILWITPLTPNSKLLAKQIVNPQQAGRCMKGKWCKKEGGLQGQRGEQTPSRAPFHHVSATQTKSKHKLFFLDKYVSIQ